MVAHTHTQIHNRQTLRVFRVHNLHTAMRRGMSRYTTCYTQFKDGSVYVGCFVLCARKHANVQINFPAIARAFSFSALQCIERETISAVPAAAATASCQCMCKPFDWRFSGQAKLHVKYTCTQHAHVLHIHTWCVAFSNYMYLQSVVAPCV